MLDKPHDSPAYASWADHAFNPWLSETRCLGSSLNVVGMSRWANVKGRQEDAVAWQAHAPAFQVQRGRLPRIFAGPWCWAVCPQANERDRRTFATLVEDTPLLDWFVLATAEQLRHPSHRTSLGLPTANLWVGTTLDDPRAAQAAIDVLRQAPAEHRYLVVKPKTDDFGDLDLRSIDWIIVNVEADEAAPHEFNCIASIKISAMAYGVPLWCDTPSAHLLRDSRTLSCTEREEPRGRRTT